jgi:hypothetical protein
MNVNSIQNEGNNIQQSISERTLESRRTDMVRGKNQLRFEASGTHRDSGTALTPPKYHTIRAGNRWKVGETFSARIWSGKPYRSKQVEFAQLPIKKIWNIEFDENGVIAIDGFYTDKDYEIAMNDGLAEDDFYSWFPMGKPFKGQIICWNENVNY